MLYSVLKWNLKYPYSFDFIGDIPGLTANANFETTRFRKGHSVASVFAKDVDIQFTDLLHNLHWSQLLG
jgi:hypothetical protein